MPSKVKRMIPLDRSFRANPKSHLWSPINTISIDEVWKSSKQKIYLRCPDCNHDYLTTPNNLLNNPNNGCGICSGNIICYDESCNDCFEKSFASSPYAQYWHLSKNGDIIPRQVFKGSGKKKYWFTCNECNHDFEGLLNSILRQNCWCPFCKSYGICDDDNCNMCFNKSFASNPKSEFWSKNNKVSPRMVSKASGSKYKFNCNVCIHEFEQRLDCVSKGIWCNYCKGDKLCENDCEICYKKSFANTEMAKYWGDKNIISSREANISSSEKYWFKCSCGHEFLCSLSSAKKRKKCRYCTIPSKVLCDDDNCKQCFDKSFESCDKSIYWDNEKNKVIKPRQVFKFSNTKKYWFICENQHSFNISPETINKYQWCSLCSKGCKTEKILFQALENIIQIKRGFKTEWCKNNKTKRCLPFDFVLENEKIIIELDGAQHFKQVRNWGSPEKQQENDKYKMKMALQNGYSVIRLLQNDVYQKKYDYKTKLIETINTIKNLRPQIVYICMNNEYDVYKE